jgi:hypothetical protein
MKHILNDLSSMEKQSILEQHKGGKQIDTSRFKTLLESKLGDVKPLVNEVANPLHQLIGKTVKFEPISIDRVTGEDHSTDEWSASELENETFSNMDASYWDLFKTEPIKAKIKGVRILTDDVILFQLENLDNIAFPDNVGADPSFKCGKDTFDITLNVDGSNSWFANKKVYGTFRNVKLAEYLNNNLPCGGFDFAKVDSEEIPNTFA